MKVQDYTTVNGIHIRLRSVKPTLITTAIRSAKIPKVPTYEVTLMGGRVERYPMDEKVAAESPELKPIWDAYQAELSEQQQVQAERSMRAMLLYGAEILDELPPHWQSDLEFIGVDVPADLNQQKVLFLMTNLEQEDAWAIMRIIMNLTGVSEDAIGKAEDSFRDNVSSEGPRAALTVADPPRTANQFMASQSGF